MVLQSLDRLLRVSLVVLVLGVVDQYGVATLGLVVGLAGILQLVAGLAGGGRWFRAVPPSVVYGMLAGIGFALLLGLPNVDISPLHAFPFFFVAFIITVVFIFFFFINKIIIIIFWF